MTHTHVQSIGILGGGQLGLMLGDALSKLGARVHILDPDHMCPAAVRTPFVTHAKFQDEAALNEFFSKCDRVTYEFEHIPTPALRKVIEKSENKYKLWPSVALLETAQNRIAEKTALKSIDIPLAAWEPVTSFEQFIDCKARWCQRERKAILKTADGGYDGKGQWSLKCTEDWQTLEQYLSGLNPFPAFVLEEMCTLLAELSVIVARHPKLGSTALPAVENIHIGGILDTTLYPARTDSRLTAMAEQTAIRIAEQLDVCGMICVEFFLVNKNGQESLVVNEIAPRPHNSGHITRCSLTRSQFDILAQLLLDLPFSTKPIDRETHWAMWNTLGDLWLNSDHSAELQWPMQIVSEPSVCEVMLYGKAEPRAGRKMGHIIFKEDTAEQIFETLSQLKSAFLNNSRKKKI